MSKRGKKKARKEKRERREADQEINEIEVLEGSKDGSVYCLLVYVSIKFVKIIMFFSYSENVDVPDKELDALKITEDSTSLNKKQAAKAGIRLVFIGSHLKFSEKKAAAAKLKASTELAAGSAAGPAAPKPATCDKYIHWDELFIY